MYRELATGTRIFHKGEIILAQGVAVEYLYLLKSGSCYRSLITDRGDSIIYEIKEADNTLHSMIGALAVYNKSSASQFTYIARSNCECLCIPAKDFLVWAAQRPDIQNQLVRITLHYYEELRITYQAHQEGRVVNRLCQILSECMELQADHWVISKKYSFSEIAGMLGIHVVTFSRMIRSLCDAGVLSKEGTRITVEDKDLLLQLAQNKRTLEYK